MAHSAPLTPNGFRHHININELKKLAQIARALCQTSSSAINLIHNDEVINVTAYGEGVGSVPLEDSFCQYTVKKEDEVLVIEDPKEDVRLENNPHVTGAPYLRFYAGAPIVSSERGVMGTLCVHDKKPKSLDSSQKEALLNLAKLANYLLNQLTMLSHQGQQIFEAAERLKLISDHAPGVLFQFSVTTDRKYEVNFVSKGIQSLLSWIKPEALYENPDVLFEVMHPEDREQVEKQIEYAYREIVPWYTEYRVINPEGKISWISSKAKPTVSESGKVTWSVGSPPAEGALALAKWPRSGRNFGKRLYPFTIGYCASLRFCNFVLPCNSHFFY